jgi:hypothetical protein
LQTSTSTSGTHASAAAAPMPAVRERTEEAKLQRDCELDVSLFEKQQSRLVSVGETRCLPVQRSVDNSCQQSPLPSQTNAAEWLAILGLAKSRTVRKRHVNSETGCIIFVRCACETHTVKNGSHNDCDMCMFDIN